MSDGDSSYDGSSDSGSDTSYDDSGSDTSYDGSGSDTSCDGSGSDTSSDGSYDGDYDASFDDCEPTENHEHHVALEEIPAHLMNIACVTYIGGSPLTQKALRDTAAHKKVARLNLSDFKERSTRSMPYDFDNSDAEVLRRLVTDIRHDVALTATFAARSIRQGLHRKPWGTPRRMTAADVADLAGYRTDVCRQYERSTREAGVW